VLALPSGGGVVESECGGNDRRGRLSDEFAQRGGPCLLEWEAEALERRDEGPVGDGLIRDPAGEQPAAAAAAVLVVVDDLV
jgi:hypothetical protein